MAWSTVVAQRLVIDRVRVRGRSVAVAEVPESARLGRDTADIVVARHEARAAAMAAGSTPRSRFPTPTVAPLAGDKILKEREASRQKLAETEKRDASA